MYDFIELFGFGIEYFCIPKLDICAKQSRSDYGFPLRRKVRHIYFKDEIELN